MQLSATQSDDQERLLKDMQAYAKFLGLHPQDALNLLISIGILNTNRELRTNFGGDAT